MRYQNIIAVLLVAGIVLGMVGGAIALSVNNRDNEPIEEEMAGAPTAGEKELPAVLPPTVADRPTPEKEYLPESADIELDMGVMEHDTNPTVVGSKVEYETKENPSDEEA